MKCLTRNKFIFALNNLAVVMIVGLISNCYALEVPNDQTPTSVEDNYVELEVPVEPSNDPEIPPVANNPTPPEPVIEEPNEVTEVAQGSYQGFFLFNTTNGVKFENALSGILYVSGNNGDATGTVEFSTNVYPFTGKLSLVNGKLKLEASADASGVPLNFTLVILGDYEFRDGHMTLGNQSCDIVVP